MKSTYICFYNNKVKPVSGSYNNYGTFFCLLWRDVWYDCFSFIFFILFYIDKEYVNVIVCFFNIIIVVKNIYLNCKNIYILYSCLELNSFFV